MALDLDTVSATGAEIELPPVVEKHGASGRIRRNRQSLRKTETECDRDETRMTARECASSRRRLCVESTLLIPVGTSCVVAAEMTPPHPSSSNSALERAGQFDPIGLRPRREGGCVVGVVVL